MMIRWMIVLLLTCLCGEASAQIPELVVERAARAPRSASGPGPIRVYVTPLDRNGRVPAGLTRSDFAVTVGGRRAAIQRVSSAAADTQGLAALLLIDTSGSMRGERIAAARAAAAGFARRLRPGDRVALVCFDRVARLVFDFTADKARAIAAIRTVQAGRQNTALFDALELASRVGWGSRPGRRAIVLLTDGKDTASILKADDSVRLAGERGVPIHSIALGRAADLRTLHRLAVMSGGTDRWAERPSELAGLYAAIWRRLTDGYVIDFVPPEASAASFQVTWIRPDGHRLTTAARVGPETAVGPGGGRRRGPGRTGHSPSPGPPVGAMIGVAGVIALLLAAAVALRLRQREEPLPVGPVSPGELETERGASGGAISSKPLFPPPAEPWPAIGAAASPAPERATRVQHPQEAPTLAWLYADAGPMKGRQFSIQGNEAVIGRGEEAGVRLADDEEVSRRHAKLVRQDGQFLIVDLASTNGLLLNGERVYQAAVRDGDRLSLGLTELIFKTIDPREGTDAHTR
jgi:VWFA-related protein